MGVREEIEAIVPVGAENAVSAARIAELLQHKYALGTIHRRLMESGQAGKVKSHLFAYNKSKIRMFWRNQAPNNERPSGKR